MPNEINITTAFKIAKGNLSAARNVSLTADMAGDDLHWTTMTVDDSVYETLDIGSITVPGYMFARNLSATHDVEIGLAVTATFYPLIRLRPGETALFRAATTSIAALADGAPARLEYLIVEA